MPAVPARLESANAKLIGWRVAPGPTPGQISAEFDGHVPFKAVVVAAPQCTLDAAASSAGLRASRVGNSLTIEGSRLGKTQFVLRCAG